MMLAAVFSPRFNKEFSPEWSYLFTRRDREFSAKPPKVRNLDMLKYYPNDSLPW